jgi:DNA-binding SARP family transcriptional activator
LLGALIDAAQAAGDHIGAIAVARELVDLDPLDEAAQGALIAAYARAGRPAQALRQYLACRRALVEELGIEPSVQTARLQARILAGDEV